MVMSVSECPDRRSHLSGVLVDAANAQTAQVALLQSFFQHQDFVLQLAPEPSERLQIRHVTSRHVTSD
jgi:hypothetical protein